MSAETDQKLQLVIDKQEIRDLSGTYMRGLDRLQRDLIVSVFHDDARTDYGFFKGNREEFADFAIGALKDHHANHHLIGQTNIDIEGDVAFGEVYFQAFHRIVEDGEEKDLFISGRYVTEKEAEVPTAFARVELDEPLAWNSWLRIEHGQRAYVIGRFLTPKERKSLAEALRSALLRARSERVSV